MRMVGIMRGVYYEREGRREGIMRGYYERVVGE